MNITFVNQTKISIPTSFLKKWIQNIEKHLTRFKLKDQELCIVFVSPSQIKKLNAIYRDMNSETDILSFGSFSVDNSIPELVICPQVLKKQAREHDLSFQFELGYMVLHGILHLLGHEHEKGGKKAKQMYDLQDKIFQKIKM